MSLRPAHTAIAVPCGAGVAVALLTAFMHGARSEENARYAESRGRQWREVGMTRPPRGEPDEAPVGARQVCVTGIDTFVVAAERELRLLAGADGPARVAAVRRLSQLAVRAERHVELAGPAPTLPKRLGSTTADGPRRSVDPPRTWCDGRAYAEFPDDVPEPTETKPESPAAGDGEKAEPKAPDEPARTKPATGSTGAARPATPR